MAAEISFTNAYVCQIKRSEIPIKDPVFKLGGSPVLYQDIDWPKCHSCRQELDFLAQIPLDAPIHFSNRYSLAYIFMCPGKFDARGWLTCPTWQPNCGANQVILQKKSEHPIFHLHESKYPEYEISLDLVKEAVVDISDYDLEDEIRDTVWWKTKVGGVPSWIQSNETPSCPICGGATKFAAQLDATLDGPLPANPNEWNSGKYKFFDFGDVGIGYLFICEKECSSDSTSFLWQCT